MQFYGDEFLRMFILRFCFCITSVSLHRAFKVYQPPLYLCLASNLVVKIAAHMENHTLMTVEITCMLMTLKVMGKSDVYYEQMMF